jgi:hypothetical protein
MAKTSRKVVDKGLRLSPVTRIITPDINPSNPQITHPQSKHIDPRFGNHLLQIPSTGMSHLFP